MEAFYCKTRIISGTDALSGIKSLNIKRLFLVTDPFFAKNGEAGRIARESQAEYTEIFDKVQPDPTVQLVAEGTARLKEFKADCIVCLGGGSAIDCGKAMKYFAKEDIPLAAIPTTSGSGAEVTDFAVITHGDMKYPLTDPTLCPDMAILDSRFLTELPGSIIADSGFDILSHALEGYVAVKSSSFSDCLAEKAFKSAYTLLADSFNGDKSVRLKIHEASCMAGIAFSQAGLGICHALSHALGGVFHIPHGRLNAILLPSVIEYNAGAAEEKYAEIARAAGISGGGAVAVRNLRSGLIRLRRALKLPETLAQAGAEPKVIKERTEEIVKAALEDVCGSTNPVKADESVLYRIIEEVTGRG